MRPTGRRRKAWRARTLSDSGELTAIELIYKQRRGRKLPRDQWICFLILATPCARVLQIAFAPKRRGRREYRVRAAPAVSCANMCIRKAHEHTGSAEAIRPSLRNGFTAYFVLSPVIGLSCHRRPREALASQGLDASVEASGPHDFAVRELRHSSTLAARMTLPRPPHPAPNVRDDRDTPLYPGRDGSDKPMIWGRSQVQFLKIRNYDWTDFK